MSSYPPWMFVIDPREASGPEPPVATPSRLARAHDRLAITARGWWTRLTMRVLLLAFRQLVPALTTDDPVQVDGSRGAPVSRQKTRVGVD